MEYSDSEELLSGQEEIRNRIWNIARMKLEIPRTDEGSDVNFSEVMRDNQVEFLKVALRKCGFLITSEVDEGDIREIDKVSQQNYFLFAYKIEHYNFEKALLKLTCKFFKYIKQQLYMPYLNPLLIFHSNESFDPSLAPRIAAKAGALFWGNIQSGVYINHWEISMDTRKPPTRTDDIDVEFEFDRNDMVLCKFYCYEEIAAKEMEIEKGFKKVNTKVIYKITIQRVHIRRILVDNSVSDHFGSDRTRIHFELNSPPMLERGPVNVKQRGNQKFFRVTTVKRGRTENEWPKDSELSNCPNFSIEFAQKVSEEKIYSILSRLRMRTSLPIEFGTFPVVDMLMKLDRPYFSWGQHNGRRLYKVSPTSDKDNIFRDFLNFCLPQNRSADSYEQQDTRHKRFALTYLLECLLSRGAIVKDQICVIREQWINFLYVVAWQIAERSLERLITMIDERKRIGFVSKTLANLFEVIKKEDASALTDDEQREGYQRVRKVIITPTRTIYVVPEMMMSNRVLRRYDPHAITVLRVAFRDDDGQKMRATKTGLMNIKRSVHEKLVHGMFIAGISYGYLGSSNSQLRDHGAYFMQKMTYNDVREWRKQNPGKQPEHHTMWQIENVRKTLGRFEQIENIPKLMARLGQCFTQSRQSGVKLPIENCAYIHDIIGGANSLLSEFTFSDGVGGVSIEFARQMAEDFGIKHGFPSCFQFRYRGLKGVLGVNRALDEHNAWARSTGRGNPPVPSCPSWIVHVALRDSQDKFYGAKQDFIEIVKVSSPSPVSLNKPFINILDQVSMLQGFETHKRVTERIEYLLDRQMRGFATQMLDETTCRNRLKELPRRIDIDTLSVAAGFEMSNEIFFRSLIKSSVRFSVTKQLKKAQIQVPYENGRTLLGITDETNRLQYGQIFVRITNSIREKFPSPNAAKRVIKGPVLMTKNPCIVAGDVRVFEAVDIPELHHLVDVVVFPQHGPRPHPDEMAGSDLDGDEYVVIWDKELLLLRNEEPFDFAVPKRVDEDVSVKIQEKMASFYVNYMTLDAVGTIANAFLTASDQFGIKHKVCLALAKKNSQALDFTKSGMCPEPLRNSWTKDEESEEMLPPEKSERSPDFQGESNRCMYQSPRLLGKLYREIKAIEDVMRIGEEKDEQMTVDFDKYLVIDGWQHYEDTAETELSKYISLLRAVMENYGIRTEAELISGCICDIRNRLSDKDADDLSFFNTNLLIETKVTDICRKVREQFFEEFSGWKSVTIKQDRQFADENNIFHREVKSPSALMKQKASAYYICCYRRAQETGERFLSFPWLIYDILANIKQEVIREDPNYAVSGNPLYQLLEKRVATYIEENIEKFEEFRQFKHISDTSIAEEALLKYCKKYDGLDKLLFIVHEWGKNMRLSGKFFTPLHLSLLVIMYFINAFASLDGDALQLLQPISIHTNIEDLKAEQFGRISPLLVKFFEFLASRKFGRLESINYSLIGIDSCFCRGEWSHYHRAAMQSYYNMVYNLRFEELPIKADGNFWKTDIIREMEPFSIELPDHADVNRLTDCLLKKCNAEEISLRKVGEGNQLMVSARGTLVALDHLRRLVTVMPPVNASDRGKDYQEKLFNMVYEKITKDEVDEGHLSEEEIW